MTTQLENLKKLREKFPDNQISKLPKPTKAQTDAVKQNYQNGARCKICGGWHHKDVIHLDYVGHAALTDRLLETDPCWTWEPFALDSNGLPAIDKDGGLWIRLTVCGVTRLGYGDAQGKTGGDAMKERIGDALRNAAMRFGAALDLWHKGDLHIDDDEKPETKSESKPDPKMPNLASVQDSELEVITDEQYAKIVDMADAAQVDVKKICEAAKIKKLPDLPAAQYEIVMKKLAKTLENR